ncbi:MAG: hypothetical protein ABIK79_01810 [Chloroflexota bacterium]|nr:hypothetical protein [Anaerolineae bacterium]
MAKSKWFDAESNELMFSKFVTQMDSWQEAMADGVIEPREIEQQVERVGELLRALEPKLTGELHEEITNVFYEIAVLYGLVQVAEITQAVEKGAS